MLFIDIAKLLSRNQSYWVIFEKDMVKRFLKGGTSNVHRYDQSMAIYLQTTFLLLDLIAHATANQ